MTVVLRAGQRAAHLPEDLSLPDGHRVQTGSDGERVRDATLLVVDEQVGLQVRALQPTGLRQRDRDVDDGPVEGEALGIHLRAVAGRDHHHLADVLGAQDLLLQGGARLGGQRNRLQQGERGPVVGQAQDDEAHGATASVRSRR